MCAGWLFPSGYFPAPVGPPCRPMPSLMPAAPTVPRLQALPVSGPGWSWGAPCPLMFSLYLPHFPDLSCSCFCPQDSHVYLPEPRNLM